MLDLNQFEMRQRLPGYSDAMWFHPRMLRMESAEIAEKLKARHVPCSCREAQFLLDWPALIARVDLIPHLCKVLLIPPEFLTKSGFGDYPAEYVEARIERYHQLQPGLVHAITMELFERGGIPNAGREEVQAAILELVELGLKRRILDLEGSGV